MNVVLTNIFIYEYIFELLEDWWFCNETQFVFEPDSVHVSQAWFIILVNRHGRSWIKFERIFLISDYIFDFDYDLLKHYGEIVGILLFQEEAF